MNLIKTARLTAAAVTLLGFLSSTASAKDEANRLGDAAKSLKVITASKKSGIPPAIFEDVVAIALYPGARKVDFMAKDRTGRGVLLVRDSAGKWSDPVFVTLSGGTIGWQAVGDPLDIILMFRSGKSIDDIMKGKLTLGGKDAKVMEGPLGKTMKGATKAQLKAEINSYIFSHGAFAPEATIAGAGVQVDAAANDAFYGKKNVDPAGIIAGKAGNSSTDLKNLHKAFMEFLTKK